MSAHVIRYYRGKSCVSQFIGDDDTIAEAIFHMNFYSFLPVDFAVTKRTADHREFVLRLLDGGYSWVEVVLNDPTKDKEEL
jgi:hypothetical protein